MFDTFLGNVRAKTTTISQTWDATGISYSCCTKRENSYSILVISLYCSVSICIHQLILIYPILLFTYFQLTLPKFNSMLYLLYHSKVFASSYFIWTGKFLSFILYAAILPAHSIKIELIFHHLNAKGYHLHSSSVSPKASNWYKWHFPLKGVSVFLQNMKMALIPYQLLLWIIVQIQLDLTTC